MKHKAIGFKLVVKPDPVIEKTKSGIIVATDKKLERNATTTGVVLDIGPEAFRAHNKAANFKDYVPWCQVGDRITYAKYAGKWVDGETEEEPVLILNDEDVTSVVIENDSSKNVETPTS